MRETRNPLSVLLFAWCALGLALLWGAGSACRAQEPAKPRQDFVPGERQIFYDDFSDMEPDSPPPHWKVRGSAVDLKTEGAARALMVPAQKYTKLIANLTQLPQNFTLETHLRLPAGGGDVQVYWGLGSTPNDYAHSDLSVEFWCRGNTGHVKLHTPSEELGTAMFNLDRSQPLAFDAWLQAGRMRLYVNNERLVDVNQVEVKKRLVAAWLDPYSAEGPLLISRVRIAEAAPDFSKTLFSTGRYVSHGIHFDVDSDRLRPESQPVLKMIADALAANPTLKLRIEGHTDATGDPQHNQELSERRAAAVKNALVAQFHVSADRLSAAGFGATKPLATNDTPEGRTENRRVEFVKQ